MGVIRSEDSLRSTLTSLPLRQLRGFESIIQSRFCAMSQHVHTAADEIAASRTTVRGFFGSTVVLLTSAWEGELLAGIFGKFITRMIDTSNPEINVDELMERVRAEAAKLAHAGLGAPIGRRALALTLPPVRTLAPQPRLPAFKAVDTKKERIDSILRDAREKSENPKIPKMFRRFFRKQGGYNRMLIDAVDRLTKTQVQIAKQLREISSAIETQGRWMRVLAEHRQSDATWMRSAAQQISDLALQLQELAAAVDAGSTEWRQQSSADAATSPRRDRS